MSPRSNAVVTPLVAAPKTTLIVEPGTPTIFIQRTFAAPRALVWEATTSPEHLRRWWGPRGHAMIHCEIDLKVGGRWRYVLRGPDGRESPFTGVYRDIVAPERLVETFIYDVDGIREHPAVSTAVFSEHDGKTTLSMIMVQDSVASRDGMVSSGMEPGMSETHARLDELLAALQRMRAKPAPGVGSEVVIVRTFAAPRALVFEAWTNPKHLARWWGPHEFDNPRCEFEAKVGGKIHIDMRDVRTGTTFPMTGEVEEIVPPERLVFIARAFFEPGAEPQIENRNTVTFTEQGGRTTITLRVKVLHASGVALPALAGMEEGWSQSLEKLARLVAKAA